MTKDKILKNEIKTETPNETSKQVSNKNNHWYYTIPGCLVFVTVVFSFIASSLTGNQSSTVIIDKQEYILELANTPELRTQGLSGRPSLPARTGMLFVFDTPAQHGIWMKDMNFSIDILWVNKDNTVVHTETNVSPDTFPTVFTSPAPSDYVIELPAGTWTESSTISW